MGRCKKRKPGAAFRGFRMGVSPKKKLNLNFLEKLSILTFNQNELVQEFMDKCTVQVKDKEGKVTETKINDSPVYVARLSALLDKPVNDAKVDHLGNPWERPKPPSKEELEEMHKQMAKGKNKKSKSRKDLEKKDENARTKI